MVHLESLVPDTHLLRIIDQYIDFECIHDRVRQLVRGPFSVPGSLERWLQRGLKRLRTYKELPSLQNF